MSATYAKTWGIRMVALCVGCAWGVPGWCRPVQAFELLRPLVTDLGVVQPGRKGTGPAYQLMQEAGEVVLLTEDGAGKTVERRVAVGVRAGEHDFPWDGTTAEGKALPAGPYRMRLRAVFADGHQEEVLVLARVAGGLPDHLGARPPTIPPEDPAHRVWGRVGGFWQKNNERPGDTGSSEQRYTLGAAYRTRPMEVEGLVDLRRSDPGEDDLDGSSGRAMRRWDSGDVSAVFRRGLATFDDPLVLFSDFRTEYRKAGIQLRQALGPTRLSGLGFTAEGDTAGEDSGAAARVTADLSARTTIGAAGTYRRMAAREADGRHDEAVGAVDLRWRPSLTGVTELFAEAALSRGFEDLWDGALVAGGRFRSGDFWGGEVSLLHLGEDFSASCSNPLRNVQSDAWGAATRGELALPEVGRLAEPGLSWSAFWLERHSRSQTLAEVDTTLRLGVGPDTGVSISWLGAWQEADIFHAVLLNVDRRWSPSVSGWVQGAFTDSGFERTGRLRLEGEVRQGSGGTRAGVEGVIRHGDDDTGRVTREAALLTDVWWGGWSSNGFARLNRRDGSQGLNLFLQVERRLEWLHRYRLRTYVALGDRAAFKTAEQIEVGVEFSF
jgi:hypothetical protein